MHISIFQRVHFGNLYAVCLAFIGPKVEKEMRGVGFRQVGLKIHAETYFNVYFE